MTLTTSQLHIESVTCLRFFNSTASKSCLYWNELFSRTTNVSKCGMSPNMFDSRWASRRHQWKQIDLKVAEKTFNTSRTSFSRCSIELNLTLTNFRVDRITSFSVFFHFRSSTMFRLKLRLKSRQTLLIGAVKLPITVHHLARSLKINFTKQSQKRLTYFLQTSVDCSVDFPSKNSKTFNKTSSGRFSMVFVSIFVKKLLEISLGVFLALIQNKN